MTSVVVAGALANKPLNGGEAWVRLTWALGLRRLGFEVTFVEQIDERTCVDEQGRPAKFAASLNRSYFDAVTHAFGLSGAAGLVCADPPETSGLTHEALLERAADAALLVNISGHLKLDELLRPITRKLYVDLDPGFTQFWQAAGIPDLGLERHDYHATVGGNVGQPGCSIPTCGLRWIPTAPPVLLDYWPPVEAPADAARFTTLGTWRSPYGPVEDGGVRYGLKAHEFRKFVSLPEREGSARFEIALDIDEADVRDRDALVTHGWNLVDPREIGSHPREYRTYIQGSAAEFSVAQGIYVDTRSGWLSDRTACYLASGRPALVQDTGLPRSFSRGEGLLTFRSLDEASAGVRRVSEDYEAHSRAARRLAERHLDAERVLGTLLEQVDVEP